MTPFVPRRLDKFVRDCTALSVVQVRCALAEGRVTIAGTPTHVEDELVFEEDDVRLDGQRLAPSRAQRHAMLHKPLSVTSTARDPRGKADLSRWLREMPPGMFPIGRLDRQTSGLLLFTTDGDLATAVLHPDHHTDKIYWLWLDEHVADDDPRLQALPAKGATIQHRTEHFTELLVTLDEGKNRQIRRMCRALDFHLVALHRRSVGPLALGDLAPGAWRLLSDEEIDALWLATGGRQRVVRRKVRALARFANKTRQSGSPHLRLESWLASRS